YADIVRDGKAMRINLPGEINLLGMLKNDPPFVRPLIPCTVDSVLPGSPAAAGGLLKGDRIVGFNGKPVGSFNEFTEHIGRLSDVMSVATTSADSMKVRKTTIVVERQSDKTLDTLSVTLSAELTAGFMTPSLGKLYKPVNVEYGLLESVPAGVSYGIGVLAGYVDDLKYVFSAEGAKSLGGFGAIGSLFPAEWDWFIFWKMTAFISIMLAFMNLLPIPALDGGHVLFLLYEIITRRKPSETFMIRAEYVGFGILILLMVVANLNDVLRWLGYM
ncbi:MAG: M50 family metallopeptidase, partial [Prevotellaceae bacterium]|nr:M50 family metallopeptidase [Prevotellaceae bacterium]